MLVRHKHHRNDDSDTNAIILSKKFILDIKRWKNKYRPSRHNNTKQKQPNTNMLSRKTTIALLRTLLLFPIVACFQNTPAPTRSNTVGIIRRKNWTRTTEHAIALGDASLFDLTSTYASTYTDTENRKTVVALFDEVASTASSFILSTMGMSASADDDEEKLTNLSDHDLAQIIKSDIQSKNSLVQAAQMTKAIYDDTCKFKDGSNLDGSYPMASWILGCHMLLQPEKSTTKMVENSLLVTSSYATFRFESDLQFRAPFSPRVSFEGRVVMRRDDRTGLIKSYEEFWDEDVSDIVQRATFHLGQNEEKSKNLLAA